MAFMREFGCELEAVTMKTDNEPALVVVADQVGRLRAAKRGQRDGGGTQPSSQQ